MKLVQSTETEMELNGAEMFLIIDPRSWEEEEITLLSVKTWDENYELASIRDLRIDQLMKQRKFEIGIFDDVFDVEPWEGTWRVEEGVVKWCEMNEDYIIIAD